MKRNIILAVIFRCYGRSIFSLRLFEKRID